jgi:hypothetical protein
MQLLPCSSVDITALYGALVLDDNSEPFYLRSIRFSLDSGMVLAELVKDKGDSSGVGLPINQIKGWKIQP